MITLSGCQIAESIGTDASSGGTDVTLGASNAKGSWAQLTAATTREAQGILLQWSNESGGAVLLDLGIGSAGNEKVLIPDFVTAQYTITGPTTANGTHSAYFPVAIPAGARVAVRGQTNAGAGFVVSVSAVLFASSPGSRSASVVEAIGVSTASSIATNLDPGGTANTEGSWTELAAATTRQFDAIVLAVHNNAILTADTEWLVDIGIGAAASEQVVIPNVAFRADANLIRGTKIYMTVPITIPAGVRVAARAQCSRNTATERVIRAALYGLGGMAA